MRSVTSMRPSGRNANPHGNSSLSVSTVTLTACASVWMVCAGTPPAIAPSASASMSLVFQFMESTEVVR
jgi:hypothetical protein